MVGCVAQLIRLLGLAAFLVTGGQLLATTGLGTPGFGAGDALAQARPLRPDVADPNPFVPGLDDYRVQMVVAQQDLTKTLEILSEQTQLRITVSKGLKGTTARLRIDGTGRVALNAIANQVGAVWWWNGSEVRLAARNDTVTQSFKARDIESAIRAARDLGMPIDLLTISKPSVVRQNVRVSGPAGLVTDFEALNEEISGRLANINVTKFGRRRVVKIE